jgi:hypothetical protein
LKESSNIVGEVVLSVLGRSSSAMVLDESENDKEMYYIAENRDTSYETLVNHSSRSSTGTADIEPSTPVPIPQSKNFNYVGKSAKGQVCNSDVPVLASLQRGQYQLKCIKLNKYQPVHLFELLDASTGRRANRSSAGKKKDDGRNLEVSFLYPLSPTHCYPEIGSMVGDMVPILLKNFC